VSDSGRWVPPPAGTSTGNPLVATYRTKDGRFVSLSCLQAARYWPEFCKLVERPELALDARFADADGLRQNAPAATELVRELFAGRTGDEWRALLADFSGQWTMVQHTLEAAADPQTIANGFVADCATADGIPFQLAAAPVQYDEEPPVPNRAPLFNEHGDAILSAAGLDWDTIVDLKVRGIVA
jgi:crotonobetainyl-CoA:carnitine CoA-transferase CaiB-like acyl-CoA transferase